MVIPFDTNKTIQAVAVLLGEHAGQMSRLRLLELLYIANRQALSETLIPITGDRLAAMDYGPIPATTNDLLRREHTDAVLWDQFIGQVGPQEHRLIRDPGVGKLSRFEIEKLRAVSVQRRDKNDYDIAVETQQFDEWIKNKPVGNGRNWIQLDDVLAAPHLQDKKQRIVDAMNEDAAIDAALLSVKRKPAIQGRS